MICSECDAQNSPGDKFCEQCGSPLGNRGADDRLNATAVASLVGSSLIPIGTNFGDPVALRTRVVVGRLHSCDLPINDASVSREHARLSRLTGGYVLEDLGSTNGTLVNGRKIEDATPLHPGDTVTFGSVAFRYHEEPAPEDDDAVLAPAGVDSNGARPDFPIPESQSSLGDMQAAAIASWNAESPLHAAQQTQGDEDVSLVAPFADPAPLSNEVEEAVEISTRLSQLVQDLAARLGKSQAEAEAARLRAGLAENVQRTYADVKAAIQRAQPLAEDLHQLDDVRHAVQALADSPRDIDVLREVADRANEVAAVVEACASLQAIFDELSVSINSAAAE
jgi:FHA domain/zinc-ribbon domain